MHMLLPPDHCMGASPALSGRETTAVLFLSTCADTRARRTRIASEKIVMKEYITAKILGVKATG